MRSAESRPPRLSIGIPVYNGGDRVALVLERVLAQEFDDFKVIISDNASTDGTPDVCAEFARTDERIRYRRQARNVGALRNFEDLLTDARGELFMWCAADNALDVAFVRRCVDVPDDEPAAVLAMSDIVVASRASGEVVECPLAPDAAAPDAIDRIRWLLRAPGAFLCFYGVIRRAALDRTRTPSELPRRPWYVGPDYRLFELALLGPFARVGAFLYEYHAGGTPSGAEVAHKLDPDPNFDATQLWMLRDLWRLGERYGLSVAERARLERIWLAALLSGGMHEWFGRANREFRLEARRERRWGDYVRLLSERVLLGPKPVDVGRRWRRVARRIASSPRLRVSAR